MNRGRLACALSLAILAAALATNTDAAPKKSGLAALDANGDHAISRREAARSQKQTFRTMDKDDDGALSRKELAAGRPQPEPKPRTDQAAKRARARALDQWLANLDADHSGDVSLAEYQAAMTPYFDRLDANGDGVIDAGELRRAYSDDKNNDRRKVDK